MPFTPFHLGPSSFLGLIFFKVFDFFTLMVSSVIVDLEPFLILIFNLGYPFHRFFHTFFGGSLVAVLTSLFIYIFRDEIKKITIIFKLNQNSSFKKILGTSFFGVYFHIILDSFINKDINPFYPLKLNPFLGIFSPGQIYLFCGFSFLVGVLFYLIRLKKI